MSDGGKVRLMGAAEIQERLRVGQRRAYGDEPAYILDDQEVRDKAQDAAERWEDSREPEPYDTAWSDR